MIALLLAFQVSAGTIGPGDAVISCTGCTTSVIWRSSKNVEPDEIAILRAPPCATESTVPRTPGECTEWMLDQSAMLRTPDGYIGQMDQLSAIPAKPGAASVFHSHGGLYLNTGNGTALLMSAGRCSYSTGWHGKFYADQDFTILGRPKKGAKPC